jgi:hypothetical protein
MSDNRNVTEGHGCIVCGKSYEVLVVYSPSGKFLDCTITSPSGGHCLSGHDRPMVACDRHSQVQVEAAIAARYPGQTTEEDREERE